MRAALLFLGKRVAIGDLLAPYLDWRHAFIAVPHIIAFAIMLATEASPTAMVAFLLAWGMLNFFWLAVLRRVAMAGALSLTMMVVLVLLSQLKYHVLMMTANFVDLMIVDTDTVSFLFTIFPALKWFVALSVLALVPLLVAVWRPTRSASAACRRLR